MEQICNYTESSRNASNIKIEYLGKFETKIKNILGRSQKLGWGPLAKPCLNQKI